MIASAMQPWQIHLETRTILVLPQDVAEMFVSMFSTKLEQLQKTSPKEVKEGSPDSQDGIWEKESGLQLCLVLLTPPQRKVQLSDRGTFLEDVTDPIVSYVRFSLGLLTLHQPVTDLREFQMMQGRWTCRSSSFLET